MIRVLFAVLLLLVAPVAAQERTADEVIRAAVNDVIRPGFDNFNENAAVLAADIERLCAAPSPELLRTAREQFGFVVEAFSRIELYRFGPLTAENRIERILFWPDRRSIGLRQVQGLLAEEDETATDPSALAGKSVALQGLGALEFVLFGTGAEEALAVEGGFRCRYGTAIAASIAGIAAEMLAEWRAPGGIADRMMAPRADDPAYRTTREVLEELVGTLSHGTEAVRDTRLLPFIGRATDDAPKPKSALFWRSDLTIRSAAANLDGLRALFEVGGLADAAPGAGDARYIREAVLFEFGNATRALGIVTDAVEPALADPKQLQALRYLVIVTQSLQALFGDQLPAALGLSVGFSSLDGD